MKNKAKVSVVIPCYNEEAVLPRTLTELRALSKTLDAVSMEFIFVDDGSTDRTKEIIEQEINRLENCRLVVFSRNFGHQIALTAGLDVAEGDAVITIDADLQDPPEVIREMVERWLDGYDVVYGERRERRGETIFKKMSASAFYRIMNRFSECDIPMDAGDFRLYSRRAVDLLRAMGERNRYLRGLSSWVGLRQIGVPYVRLERFAGRTKYPLGKMMRLAVDGMLAFSSKPLYLSIGVGLASAAIAVVGIVYALIVRIFTESWVPGWATLYIGTLFLGGIQLICIGILGLYIGRIHDEVKARPLYVVDEYVGFDDGDHRFSRSPI